MIRAILLLLLTALTALAQVPPMPQLTTSPVKVVSPKHAEHLSSLGKVMVKAAATPAAAPVAQFLTLAWDYPSDQIPLVAFQIWHATTLTNSPPMTSFDQIPTGFTMISEVTGATNYQIQPYLAAEFFIVRARDLATGALSSWNAP